MSRASSVVIMSLLITAPALLAEAISTSKEPASTAPFAIPGPSVRDFGAKGDGKADDTVAIEAAVKAGAGAAYFPKGDYRISRTIRIDLDAAGRTSLVGTGGATILMAGPGPAFHFV